MTLKSLMLAAASSALLCGTAAAAEFTGEATFPWLAVGTTYTIEDGHPYFVGAFSGVWQVKNAAPARTVWANTYPPKRITAPAVAGPLHLAAVQCPAYFDIGVGAGGYCVVTATDGDELYLRFNCSSEASSDGAPGACLGRAEFIGGTGKFADATGGDEFSAHTLAVHPDGTASGYSELRNVTLRY